MSDKFIFQYFNGEENVYGDPLAIQRRLTQALGCSPNQALEISRSKDPALAAEADEKIMQAVRFAFEMVPWNPQTGEGATEADCRAALAAYSDFLEKKNLSAA